jgi:hypothetical protein
MVILYLNFPNTFCFNKGTWTNQAKNLREYFMRGLMDFVNPPHKDLLCKRGDGRDNGRDYNRFES